MIPAQIKFGCEKSRILTLGMMGVIAAIAYLCEVVFGKRTVVSGADRDRQYECGSSGW